MHIRQTTVMFALLLYPLMSMGQTIPRCEYWLDSNYSAHRAILDTDTVVTASVSLENIESGIHFFNFRAINSAGEVGKIFRTMFYLPDRQVGDVAVAGYEYWMDDAYSQKNVTNDKDTLSMMSVSLEGLKPGIHFFNFRAFNSAGEVGKMFRTMFFLPEETTTEVSGYEYWFDNDTANAVTIEHDSDVIELAVDVKSLTIGEHTFNIRVRNGVGQWGSIFVETFTLSAITSIFEIGMEDKTFDVYSLSGILLYKDISRTQLKQLPCSVYVINGKKVLIK